MNVTITEFDVQRMLRGVDEALRLHEGGAGPEDIADEMRAAGMPTTARAYEFLVYGLDPDKIKGTLREALAARPDDFEWTEAETRLQTEADQIPRRLRELRDGLRVLREGPWPGRTTIRT